MSLCLSRHSAVFFLGPMSVSGPSQVGTDAANDEVAERRGCAGTEPLQLQRSVIHDLIKLLNGDAGLWVGVVTGTRKTHIIAFFLVDVF